MAGGNPPGFLCASQVGDKWMDGGTSCLSLSPAPVSIGINVNSNSMIGDGAISDLAVEGYLRETSEGKWVFSEFPQQTFAKKKPSANVVLSIKIDERNLAIGKARYAGAKHLNKYIAIHPGGPGGTGAPIVHSNVELRISVDGKEMPMTQRRVRYWEITFPAGSTVANGGKWDVDRTKKAFPVWDNPGAEDAPGMNFVTRPKKTVGDMHEFVAGIPKHGGYYYQEVTLYDPDGTVRIMVFNLRPLTPKEFSAAIRRVDRRADLNDFLFPGELTEERKSTDSGILTTIPDMAKSIQNIQPK